MRFRREFPALLALGLITSCAAVMSGTSVTSCAAIQGLGKYENVECVAGCDDANADDAGVVDDASAIEASSADSTSDAATDGPGLADSPAPPVDADAGGDAIAPSDATTKTFTVGGSISGLSGSGLVLRINGAGDLPISGNAFVFPTAIADGGAYVVTVATQPKSPAQTCTVSGASGSIAGANVTSVKVACVLSYKVGGAVSGLTGSGLVLRNNGGDDLPIAGNGSFTFATGLADSAPYAVTVATQPSSPVQACTVTGGSGTIASGDITKVTVTCVTTHASCKALHAASPALPSGVYTISPAGVPLQAFCDMTTDGGGWTLFVNRITASDLFGQLDVTTARGAFDNGRTTNWNSDLTAFYAAATELAIASKHNTSCSNCTIASYDSALKFVRGGTPLTLSCTSATDVKVTKLVGPSAGTTTTSYICPNSVGWGSCANGGGTSVCHYGVHSQNTTVDGSWSSNLYNEMHFPSAYSSYRSFATSGGYCRSCSGGVLSPPPSPTSSTCCNTPNSPDASTWTMWVR